MRASGRVRYCFMIVPTMLQKRRKISRRKKQIKHNQKLARIKINEAYFI